MSGPLPRGIYWRRRAGLAVVSVVALACVAALAIGRSDERAATDDSPGGREATEPPASAEPPDVLDGEVVDRTTTTTWGSTGRFEMAAGESEVAGTGPVKQYTVEVEVGAGVDVDEFAAEVDDILADRRGWAAVEGIGFQRVSGGEQVAFTVRLSAPDTVDLLCAPLETEGDVSCAQEGMAVINTMRWHLGAEPSGLGLVDYRRYLISHEVGHLLGHGHVECPGPGQPAPVMMQQTLDIGDCAPNPWPAPEADRPHEAAGG